MTFEQAANAYIDAHTAGWRGLRTEHRWRSELERYACPAFGRKDVASVTVEDVLRVLSPIWATKNETASKLRGRLENVLEWATVKGYRQGPNPAAGRGGLKHLLPARAKVHTVTHHPALPWQNVPAFMSDLRQQGGLSARALELVLLTACRSGEALQARRAEFAGELWTIPKERMKMRREHRIPLAVQVRDLLAAQLALVSNPFLFPGQREGKPLSNMALEMLLRRGAHRLCRARIAQLFSRLGRRIHSFPEGRSLS